MSCGQKKQNKPGGIHLTERTCSPYNPIIRQMVDDCLGLPVYPVTSIDSFIDEDGNTLRKLLEDLKLQITEGLSIEEITQRIETILSNLNNYVTTEQFVSLKDWLLKISSLGDIDPSESEERQSPTIVEEFNSLQDLVNRIFDVLGISGQTDTEDLIGIVTNLKNLVEEIGKCGQENLRTEGVVQIVEYVTDLLTRVRNMESRAGTGYFAHLNSDINKLNEDEYPVSSAMFILDNKIDLQEFVKKVNSLQEEESIYVWIKDGIRFGLKVQDDDSWLQYDYNEDEILDFFDVAILENAIATLPSSELSRFDLNHDNETNVADVNWLIDLILNKQIDSNHTYFATNECSNYIYQIIKPKSTLVFGAAGEITDLTEIPYFQNNDQVIVKKHPVIDGKLYSDTSHDVVYRCKINRNGIAKMIRQTNLVGENEISIDFQNEDNQNLIYVKFTPITCRGNLDDLSVNEYYIENNNGIYLSGVPVSWLQDSTNSNSTQYQYQNISTYALTGGITIVTKYLNHFMEQSVSSISPQHQWNSYQRKRNELINLYNNIADNEEETDLRNEILEEIAKIANINTSSETPTLNDEFYRENVRDLIRTRGSQAVASAQIYEQEHYIGPTPRPIIFGAANDAPSIYKYVGPGDPDAADLYAHDTAIYELKTLDSDETKVAWSKLFSVNGDSTINITDITMLIQALMSESELTRGVASINFNCILKQRLEDEDRVVTELPIGTHVFDIDNNLEYIVVKPETGKLMLYPSIKLEQFVDDNTLTTEVYMNDNLVDFCSSELSY